MVFPIMVKISSQHLSNTNKFIIYITFFIYHIKMISFLDAIKINCPSIHICHFNSQHGAGFFIYQSLIQRRINGTLYLFYLDRKSTRLNSSHVKISYAVFCLKKKKRDNEHHNQ